ncbi:hypothetical protein WA026_015932 [Henosepilachna vigintioctopunctata]|uniref:Transcription factor CBF/NF-Y/archaeal histone domain-containing protein n=1 Tax=Henosepilachna vigintioctopunctata TaxID=420089 RepID=A0AAW1TZ81_9CUCU
MNEEINKNLDMSVECSTLENLSESELEDIPEKNSKALEESPKDLEENLKDANENPTVDDNPEVGDENPKEPTEDQVEIEKNDNKPIKLKFPFNKIKQIMKSDPDCYLVSTDAVALVSKASEMFIESLGREAFKHIAKRKTIMKKDIDFVIDNVIDYSFLDGALDWD